MLVHEAACRPDRVVCVVGVAGSGKTIALRALADAYRDIDATVLGAAPSGRAADELQTATGIRSRTLHRLLLDAQRDGGLPHGCVLVVDEAGMAETRVLAPLLHAVDRAEGKLLLVGDPAQLPAVGAGGLYQALCDRLDPIELTGNRRQRDPLEREALARLRARRPRALPRPRRPTRPPRRRRQPNRREGAAARRLVAGSTPQPRPQRDARLPPRRRRRAQPGRARADAPPAPARRRSRHARRARVPRRRSGPLPPQRQPARPPQRHARHRRRARRRRASSFATGAGVNRHVPFAYAAEHLDYGYALTGHAAQGLTVDRAFVLLPDQGALQEWGYVACSRARLQTRLYLADRDLLERETPLARARPGRPARTAARALQRSSAEPLALDQRRSSATRSSACSPATGQARPAARAHGRATRTAAKRGARTTSTGGTAAAAAELQTEIALHAQALDRCDAKAEQLRRSRRAALAELALARERDELARSLMHRNRRAAARRSSSTASRPAAGSNSEHARPRSELEQPQELLATDARRVDDRVQRPSRQVARVHRHDHSMPMIRVTEDVVASSDAIELPAAPLQPANRLARRHRRQPRRHAETVTRSISIGPGIGSPCAWSDSR